jgi:hypothetical protein
MNAYYTEDLKGGSFVVYVVESGDVRRLLRAFPGARRTTRARAVKACRAEDREGDWCRDTETDPVAIRNAENDADITEAYRASYRAIAYHEEFFQGLEEWKQRAGMPRR